MSHASSRRFSPSQAHRLDAPERKLWLPVAPVLAQLELKPGMTVADIGAGTGYFALPMAEVIGPDGRLMAVDVSAEMQALLSRKIVDAAITNIDCMLAESANTGLAPGSFDRVLLANVWHEVEDRAATLAEAARLLRPEGRVAILDWSPELPASKATKPAEEIPGPPLAHRIPLQQVCQDLTAQGWHIDFAGTTGQFSWLAIATRPPQ